jgi:glyoxylase-like metal-dependent hydrolase (beta-lactamase superfamily II)
MLRKTRSSNDGEVHTQHVQGNVYMLSGAGGNITCKPARKALLVVDTGLPNMTDKVVAAIRKISDGPIRYVVNTHVHPDHTGGNEKIAGLGSTIVGGNVTGDIADAGKGASVIAHQTLLDRMSAKDGNQAAYPSGAWPTDTYADEKDLFFDGEGIEVLHQPAAHTDGDSFVFFRRSDVVSAGDIFVTTGYPIIDLARRQPARDHRCAEPFDRDHHSGRQAGRRHHGDSGPRPFPSRMLKKAKTRLLTRHPYGFLRVDVLQCTATPAGVFDRMFPGCTTSCCLRMCCWPSGRLRVCCWRAAQNRDCVFAGVYRAATVVRLAARESVPKCLFSILLTTSLRSSLL